MSLVQCKFSYYKACFFPQDIAKQALSVTKALAGNDNVKEAVVQNGGVQVILAAMTKHQANPRIAELGAATLGAIVLRNESNCKRVMELNAHHVLLQAMKIHSQDVNVQVLTCHKALDLYRNILPLYMFEEFFVFIYLCMLSMPVYDF